MSSIPPQQGDIILHGLMSLENHHPLLDKLNTFIYDAIFSCTDSDNDGIGSFRHYIGTDKTNKQDGFYKTNARIVGFKPGCNINSNQYTDSDINLMGEIQTMQPLTAVNEDNFNYDMHISTTGVIVSKDRPNASFVLHRKCATSGNRLQNLRPLQQPPPCNEKANCNKKFAPVQNPLSMMKQLRLCLSRKTFLENVKRLPRKTKWTNKFDIDLL
ncbi:hypothetical protein EI94DRAFT_1702080 [Lactarius quietus]|nr:hypothetical protein EI94DRAFT_1702080 [Lactarius quietus]